MMQFAAPSVENRAFKTLTAFGDSHTYAESGIGLANYYPAVWQSTLRVAGVWATIVNLGSSGFTTGQVLNRINSSTAPYARPDSLAVLYAGTNDEGAAHVGTVQASPAPTTTVFTLDAGKGDEFFAGSNILVGSTARIVQSVSADEITITVALSGAPSAGTEIKHDTAPNLIDAGDALIAKGYTKIIVGIQHYFNFSTGGDTLETPRADMVTLRAKQQLAIDTLGDAAVAADFYTYMRNRIVAGTDVQGDFAWHVADANTHLNAYGEGILASCIDAALPSAWREALK